VRTRVRWRLFHVATAYYFHVLLLLLYMEVLNKIFQDFYTSWFSLYLFMLSTLMQ
jgi:hypothetical protein